MQADSSSANLSCCFSSKYFSLKLGSKSTKIQGLSFQNINNHDSIKNDIFCWDSTSPPPSTNFKHGLFKSGLSTIILLNHKLMRSINFPTIHGFIKSLITYNPFCYCNQCSRYCHQCTRWERAHLKLQVFYKVFECWFGQSHSFPKFSLARYISWRL